MAAGGDAKILAVYSGSYYAGKPALIETKCGKGRVLHFGGTFTRENVRVFLKYAGILSPFSEIVSAPEECEIGGAEKRRHRLSLCSELLETAAEDCPGEGGDGS